MKLCTKCHTTKPLTEFSIKIKETGQLQSRCKPCVKILSHHYYVSNDGKHKSRIRKAKDARLMVIIEAKSKPCSDCNIQYPYYVMDLDHRPDTIKIAEVSRLYRRGATIQTILEEISKCDAVCANCHRIRTFKRK